MCAVLAHNEPRGLSASRTPCVPLSILSINPGSMTTKLALHRDREPVGEFELEWQLRSGLRGAAMAEEIARYEAQIAQFLVAHELRPDAVVGRGGFIPCARQPLPSGVYEVAVVRDGRAEICADIYRGVTESPELDHPANYGIPIAARIALAYNIPAFTVDPVVVDELADVARFSGYAAVTRRSLAHVLSVRAMARQAALELDRDFAICRFVAVHLGGGISVAAVHGGRIVDVNNALLGGGPFSPQRVGSLPMRDLIDLCYSGRFSKAELQVELTKRGGLISYLGEDQFPRIEARIAAGDTWAARVVQAMAYQIAKEIGAMAVAVGGRLDAVVFSGGLSRSKLLLDLIRPQVSHLGSALVFPGSLEMQAMAEGAYRVLRGGETARQYSLNPIKQAS
jgi:butyrate kinase